GADEKERVYVGWSYGSRVLRNSAKNSSDSIRKERDLAAQRRISSAPLRKRAIQTIGSSDPKNSHSPISLGKTRLKLNRTPRHSLHSGSMVGAGSKSHAGRYGLDSGARRRTTGWNKTTGY